MKILVAGIGNIFFGDDAFGCEAVRELARRGVPEYVTIKDFGIRGYDLAFALTDDYDAAILVDVVSRGGFPGTLYLIEPDVDGMAAPEKPSPDGHSMDPAAVIQMAQSFGTICGRIFLIGCEPETWAGQDEEGGISSKVREAIPQALAMIESLVTELRGTNKIEEETAGLVPA